MAGIDAMVAEIKARMSNTSSGEIYITWKGSNVQMKFSQWLVKT